MCEYIFVYGTLMNDKTGLLKDCEFVFNGTIDGSLYNIGSYPGAKLDGKSRIHGQIYRLPLDERERERVLDSLDSYESVDMGLYSRQAVEVMFAGIEEDWHEMAYVYEYNGNVGRQQLIEDGRWKAF